MLFRHSLSRRDALLVIIGATTMYVWSVLSLKQTVVGQSIVFGTQYLPQEHYALGSIPGPQNPAQQVVRDALLVEKVLRDAEPLVATPSLAHQRSEPIDIGLTRTLPHTSIIAHAPGWTIFRNLYMSNGTLYILSSNRSFPEIRMMTSTGLPASNTPGNEAAREPTRQDMDFINPEEAQMRWGANVDRGKNQVVSIDGNTLLFNDPPQFLRHYYHFVAELFFGTWAFWHGAWSIPSTVSNSAFRLAHPSPPPIHRAIFAHSSALGWRDDPGFNAYFLRAAFPSLTVEVQEDWLDRIATTDRRHQDRAWHFPILLLADRSAAHRGRTCGSLTQRTASEALRYMNTNGQLMGLRVGGWWEPLRKAVWEFAGVVSDNAADDVEAAQAGSIMPMPRKVVITYISRQGVPRRKLKDADHDSLVATLEALVLRKGDGWELVVSQAEGASKDEQVRAAARTTILLGVHGNGLTHLVFMKPTRAAAVIEIFYPGGFAHDYHWTTRALGMDHYAVWDDKHFTFPNEPPVNYPDPGFQGNGIPVNGPAVAQLIEDHINRKRKLA